MDGGDHRLCWRSGTRADCLNFETARLSSLQPVGASRSRPEKTAFSSPFVRTARFEMVRYPPDLLVSATERTGTRKY